MKRSLLIDAGAEFNGYAADVTRTYSASGGDDFAALIGAVDALQQRICDEVKPGVDFVALHVLTHRLLAERAARQRDRDVQRRRGGRDGHHARFPAARARTSARPASARRGRPTQKDVDGTQARAAGARSVPAAHAHAAARRRRHDRARASISFRRCCARLLAQHEAKLNRALIERLVPFGGIRIEDDVEVTLEGSRNLTREAFAAVPDAVPTRGRGR